MLAHTHSQIWSAADPARSMGVSEPTMRRYLGTLTQTLMVRQLQPWFADLGKRQVKSPKVYFRDSGLLHALLDVTTLEQLLSHPRSGASADLDRDSRDRLARAVGGRAAHDAAHHNAPGERDDQLDAAARRGCDAAAMSS